MSSEWFDLGARLRAATSGQPQPRLCSAPFTAAEHPVAVRTAVTADQVSVTVAAPGTTPVTATGSAGLAALAAVGVAIDAPAPATLVCEHPRTLTHLARLAAQVRPGDLYAATAAHIAWWADRADFPGGMAVLDTTWACRQMWVSGRAPAAEADPATWRKWLDVPDQSVTGLLDLYQRLATGGPLPLLSTLAEDDLWSFELTARDFATGADWRRPDAPGRAAVGLRARCDAADLFATALLADPLYRLRAVHTGHLVAGVVTQVAPDRSRRVWLSTPRLDARLRPGEVVSGWVGSPTSPGTPLSATVAGARVEGGHLLIELTGVTGQAPPPGAAVCLHAAGANVHRQRAARRAYRSLVRTHTWLTTGSRPTATRRDVPLEVLVAGAEPDPDVGGRR